MFIMKTMLVLLVTYVMCIETGSAKSIWNETVFTELVGRVETLEKELSEIDEVQRKREPILLHVKLSTSMTDVSNHVTIIFDQPVIDTGHHYNENDGIFISPVSGKIMAYWTITSDETAQTELMVEDRVIGTLVTSASSVTTNSRYGASSTTVKKSTSSTVAVTEVQKGDHIFLRTASNDNHILAVSSSLIIRVLA